MSVQRPKYQRANPPPAMRFQARDGEILNFIYACDGVVARRHLHARFWPGKSWRAMEKRLSLLYHNAYLNWPGREQWRYQPISEPVCWLGYQGIRWLAGSRGSAVELAEQPGESDLRRFELELRQTGIHWQRQPRWSQLVHDLAVVDFRLKLEQDLLNVLNVRLAEWTPEGAFLRESDVIEFRVRNQAGHVRKRKKGVRPDGVFVLCDAARQAKGLPAHAHFLLELDNATHSVPNFGREKVAPGLAYLKSTAYRLRFGTTAGRWLFVTRGGERRIQHLMLQTAQVAGREANLFYFATWEQLAAANSLRDPVWWQVGKGRAVTLI